MGSVSMVDGHIDPETRRMTEKEIIQALECCADLFDCISCPCKEFCGDLGKLQQNALDLINRQQAENKELKTENLILSQKRFNIFERIEFTDKLKKQIKSEAIKEFAVRLKANASTFVTSSNGVEIPETKTYQIRGIDIDDIAQEMVGDD